jgi:hypothetical protein
MLLYTEFFRSRYYHLAFYIFTVTGHFRKFKDNGKTSRVRKIIKENPKKAFQ